MPLILVHGWNKDAVPAPPLEDLWDPFIGFYNARPALFANFKLYRLLYWSNHISVETLGGDLRDRLDELSAADPDNFGQKPIVIVAHSMGGLISRQYLKEESQSGPFAGKKGADRVLRLITLGTPHHGSPMANGPAMEARALEGGVVLADALATFFALYYGVLPTPDFDELNRTDMHWDNYDNLLPYGHPLYSGEKNDYLTGLNADTACDKKIIAYAGSIGPSGLGDMYSWGATVLGGMFELGSDGVVPVSSAFFFNDQGISRALGTRYCTDCDHSELPRGNGDWRLFYLIEADLLAALPTPLTATGLITTVAGGGTGGTGGLATDALLYTPRAVAVDGAGDLYVAVDGSVVHKVTTSTGLIQAVAGGSTTNLGDNGPATSAWLFGVYGLAVDGDKNIYIADYLHSRIRKVTAATGIITTIAGTGTYDYGGDGGLATEAQLNRPKGVAVDGGGNVYIADTSNNRVRCVAAASGLITTVAGTGAAGFSGDGGAATAAQLNGPNALALDRAGNLYISDTGNRVIRKVAAGTGLITTVAGTGAYGSSGDGGPATAAKFTSPRGIALDRAGNLYIVDYYSSLVRRVAVGTGVITTLAGGGTSGLGDGGPATAAELLCPEGVAVDNQGHLYVADAYNDRVRMVVLDPTTTVKSEARADFTGDLKSDLLWRGTAGDLWLWPMNGATRGQETYGGTVSDGAWQIRSVADHTGDGRADLLWRHAVTGAMYLWPGGLQSAEAFVGTVPVAYDIVGTGDYDGDGKADLLWRNVTQGDLWLWKMDGAARVSEAYAGTAPPAYVVRGSGDLDLDGKADLVWQHGTQGDVWVWLMNGATRLSEAYVTTVADLAYQVKAVADFTGDGKADILWRHATHGDAWLWTMNGAARQSETYVGTVDPAYEIVAAGDYDADRKADILWRHATQGDAWMWLMDGAALLSEKWVATIPTSYQLVK